MKIRIKIGLIALCAFIFCTSCYKDKGNYEYTELDKVIIDTADNGILPSYAIYRYDKLTIKPKIRINGLEITNTEQAKNEFEFTWAIYQGSSGGKIHTRDTLSNELEFDHVIEKPAGRWIVILSVKNKKTNVEEYMKFSVLVDEQLSDGWMVLYGKNGNTDVGLIVDDWSKIGATRTISFADIFSTSNGYPLAGEPISLIHSAAPIASAEVLIMSSKDFVAVEKSSFQVFYPFEKLFWQVQKGHDFKALAVGNNSKEVALYNNRIHLVNFRATGNLTSRADLFGVGFNGEYGDLAEWSATAFGASFDAVVYDKTNKRFQNVPARATRTQSFAEQTTTAAFDVNNVGLDPEAFDWGRGTGAPTIGYEYSIMKNSTERFLLVSNFTNAALNRIGIGKYPVRGIPVSTKVTSVASAFGGNYTLVGTNNALYLHHYIQGTDATVEWETPTNEEISCVRIQKFFSNPAISARVLPRPNTVVYIATWNPGTQQGKVYSYLIDATSGKINKSSERIHSGFGKIKDMSYKWTL